MWHWFLIAGALLGCALPEPSAAQDTNDDLTIEADDTTQDVLAKAREAAGRDRNQDSRRLYQEVLSRRPVLRRRILREYADQVLYSGGAREAVPLYQEYIALRLVPGDERAKAERNLALAFAWSGQHLDALQQYDRLLARNPNDGDLIVGKAEVLGLMDRNADAAATYTQAFEIEPSKCTQHLAKYASQFLWSGRKEEAIPLLEEYLAATGQPERDRFQADKNLALAYAWAGRHQDSIRTYDRLLEQQPRNAELMVSRAQVLGLINLNAEAAEAYEQAFETDPGQRDKNLARYTEQLLWADRKQDAVPLFREMLRRKNLGDRERTDITLKLALGLSWMNQHAEALSLYDSLLRQDEGNIQARLGRGRVLLWRGNIRGAEAEFQEVLRRDPNNAEAKRALVQARSWRGRQRRAARDYEAILAENPRDKDARLQLAQTLFWMGRPDRALSMVRGILAEKPEDRQANQLLTEIRYTIRPLTELDAYASTQTNRLSIRSGVLRHSHFFNDGMTQFGLSFQSHQYLPEKNPKEEILIQAPGLLFAHRFNDALRIDGAFSLNVLHGSEFRERGGSIVVPTFDIWGTIQPNDAMAVYPGVRRTLLDNIQSLRQRITATYVTLSADIRLAPESVVSMRGDLGSYTDGNSRVWGQLAFQQQVGRSPNIFLGVEATAFAYRKILNNGYWNPLGAHTEMATFRIWDEVLNRRLDYELEAAAGVETQRLERGREEIKPIWRAGGAITYLFADAWEIRGRVIHFGPFGDPAHGGFARTVFGITLRRRW